MIVEGVKLTLLGVGIVYVFLSLLVVVIKLSSRVLKPLTEKEEASYQAIPAKKMVSRRAEEELQRVIAVINAAIAAHRVRKAAMARMHGGAQTASAKSKQQSKQYILPGRPEESRQPHRRPFRAGELFFRDRSTLGGYLHHR
jgi:oxaloacetate decarboxylase gamma subunit